MKYLPDTSTTTDPGGVHHQKQPRKNNHWKLQMQLIVHVIITH
jgi:hypothetical protein